MTSMCVLIYSHRELSLEMGPPRFWHAHLLGSWRASSTPAVSSCRGPICLVPRSNPTCPDSCWRSPHSHPINLECPREKTAVYQWWFNSYSWCGIFIFWQLFSLWVDKGSSPSSCQLAFLLQISLCKRVLTRWYPFSFPLQYHWHVGTLTKCPPSCSVTQVCCTWHWR